MLVVRWSKTLFNHLNHDPQRHQILTKSFPVDGVYQFDFRIFHKEKLATFAFSLFCV